MGVFLTQRERAGAARVPRSNSGGRFMSTETVDALREQVRERYAQAARAAGTGSSADCGDGSCCSGKTTDFGEALYSEVQRDELPDNAVLASLGCGNPTAVADLQEGEVVL